MTTSHTRVRRFPRRGLLRGRRTSLLVAAVGLPVLLLSACSDEDAASAGDDGDSPSAAAEATTDEVAAQETSPAADAGTGRSLPPNMPDGIPIPDEHMVLRTTSMTGDQADAELGEHVAVNVAIGGDVDEQRAHYEAELRAAYGDVELEDGIAGEALRFGGEWFENGRVFVSENEGHFDNDAIDSSHLPVMLSVQVWEHLEE